MSASVIQSACYDMILVSWWKKNKINDISDSIVHQLGREIIFCKSYFYGTLHEVVSDKVLISRQSKHLISPSSLRVYANKITHSVHNST